MNSMKISTSNITDFKPIQKNTSYNNTRDTLILVPCALGIDHKTDEKLRILESMGYQVWRQPGYSAIDQCRNKMIYNFLTYTEFKRILWIDGDIIFEPSDVEKLENSNMDIVGATYPFKGHPQFTFVPENYNPISFGNEGEQYIKVRALATGFLMITRETIENIIAKLGIPLCNTSFDNPSYPLFTPAVIEGETYIGEDFGFCDRAIKCGYDIYLDTTIQLKHVGRYEYSWSDIKYELPKCDSLIYNEDTNEVREIGKTLYPKSELAIINKSTWMQNLVIKIKKGIDLFLRSIKIYDKEDFN